MVSPEAQNKYEISATPPSVEQMLELQRIGVVTAKEQEKLKESRQADNAHLFLAKQIEDFGFSEIDNRPFYWTHRFTGRVARTDYRQWSMRIAEAFWVQDESVPEQGSLPSKINDGYRASYVFEWNQDKVQRAFKHIHARALAITGDNRTAQEPDFGLESEGRVLLFEKHRPTIESFDPEIIPAADLPSEEMIKFWTFASLLSDGDCNRLADDMRAFSQATLSHHSSS